MKHLEVMVRAELFGRINALLDAKIRLKSLNEADRVLLDEMIQVEREVYAKLVENLPQQGTLGGN